MSITLLIERQNRITRLNRSARGTSVLVVTLRLAVEAAWSGMRGSGQFASSPRRRSSSWGECGRDWRPRRCLPPDWGTFRVLGLCACVHTPLLPISSVFNNAKKRLIAMMAHVLSVELFSRKYYTSRVLLLCLQSFIIRGFIFAS